MFFLKLLAHVILKLILIFSLMISGLSIYRFSQIPLGARLIDLGASEIQATMNAAIAREYTQPEIEAHLMALLESEPRNWVVIQSVVDVMAENGFGITDEGRARLRAADAEDSGILAASWACVSCAWDSSSCELSVALLCRLPIDLTPVGDISTLIFESSNYVLGYEVDQFDLVLALVGVSAVVIIPITGGTSATLKAGTSILKLAKSLGRITPGLMRMIRGAFSRAVDWSVLAKTSVTRFLDDVPRAIRRNEIQPIARLVDNMSKVSDRVGIPQTLHLVGYVDDVSDSARLASLTGAVANKSSGYLSLLGKNRVFRAIVRWSDEVAELVFAVLGLIYAFFAIVLNFIISRSLRKLRRLARATPSRPKPNA